MWFRGGVTGPWVLVISQGENQERSPRTDRNKEGGLKLLHKEASTAKRKEAAASPTKLGKISKKLRQGKWCLCKGGLFWVLVQCDYMLLHGLHVSFSMLNLHLRVCFPALKWGKVTKRTVFLACMSEGKDPNPLGVNLVDSSILQASADGMFVLRSRESTRRR